VTRNLLIAVTLCTGAAALPPVARAAESMPAASAPAAAPAPPPTPRALLFAEGDLIATYRRLGALLDLYLRFRYRLYDSKSDAFAENYVGAGIVSQTSPVFSQNGLYIEVAPTAFLRVTAGYEMVWYLGLFNSALVLQDCNLDLPAADPRCNFDVPILPRPANAVGDVGHRVWVSTRLRAKVGPIIVADTFNVERWWWRPNWAGGPDAFWYNEMHYLPQERADTALTNNGSLLYEVLPDRGGTHPHVLIGVDDRLAYAVGTTYLTHRVGLIGIYRLPELGSLRDVAAVALVEWYTNDRYKVGPIPFVGLVVAAATPNLL